MHIYLLCPGAVLKWIQLDSTDPICHCQYNMPPQFMRLYRSYLPCDEWSFLVPLIGGIYCQLGDYIYITYDLLREPETAIDVILRILGFFLSSSFTGWIYPLKTNKHGHSKILQYIDFLSKKASFWVSDTIKKKLGMSNVFQPEFSLQHFCEGDPWRRSDLMPFRGPVRERSFNDGKTGRSPGTKGLTCLPSRKLTYPTLGKGKSSSNAIFLGYVSSLEGNFWWVCISHWNSAL